jgi:hypothetical protein
MPLTGLIWQTYCAKQPEAFKLEKRSISGGFCDTAKPIEALCPRFSSPVAGAAFNKADITRAFAAMSNSRSALCACLSLADLNSYN